MTRFYAYLHFRPDFTPFYVGKTCSLARARSLKRNIHHRRIVANCGAENIGVGFLECSSEQTAFDLEIGLIKRLRRNGVKLSNMTDGGEGSRGSIRSAEAIAKASAANRGRVNSAEVRATMGVQNIGRVDSAETTARKSAASTGRAVSEERRKKIGAANKGRVFSAESLANMKAGRDKIVYDAEYRAKVSEKSKGRPCSAETRAKMSVSTRAFWLRRKGLRSE
jgi:hypothetical protein